MLKNIKMFLCSGVVILGVVGFAFAEDEAQDFFEPEEISEEVIETNEDIITNPEPAEIDLADQVSANALNDFQVEGSLFEKITTLEQEKVVIQLEKERAQLDLELERLNAERIKLQMELDTLSGRAEQQQRELETAKAQLEIKTEQLKRQKEAMDNAPVEEEVVVRQPQKKKQEVTEISSKYKLINVVGIDNQLQATLEEVTTGQNKRVSVGKNIDGYTIQSISLNDGVVFEKDGEIETLNIGK